ncbi:hypothetical protein ACWGDE_39205, partial [Streptomyces sp. NPDC054956]
MDMDMDTTTTTATPQDQDRTAPTGRDRSRLWAILSAALFVPAAVLTGILTLASERASRCMTYGEQCTQGMPGWLFGWG